MPLCWYIVDAQCMVTLNDDIVNFSIFARFKTTTWLGLAWLGLAWLLVGLGLAGLGLAWLGLAWLSLACISACHGIDKVTAT